MQCEDKYDRMEVTQCATSPSIMLESFLSKAICMVAFFFIFSRDFSIFHCDINKLWNIFVLVSITYIICNTTRSTCMYNVYIKIKNYFGMFSSQSEVNSRLTIVYTHINVVLKLYVFLSKYLDKKKLKFYNVICLFGY